MAHVNSLVSKFEQISHETAQLHQRPGRVRVKRYDMALRQSTLSFARNPTVTTPAPKRRSRGVTPPKQTTPPVENQDEDTIVVAPPDEPAVEAFERSTLPTPSESATDASSQSSSTPKMKSPPKSRSKRVSSTQKTTERPQVSPLSRRTATTDEKLRNISGDTLIPDASLSQTSLVKESVEKLNLTWDMNAGHGSEEEEQQPDNDGDSSNDSDTIMLATDACTDVSTERRASKQVKIQEKNNKWEQRKQAADDKATRRSSRASMLISKASEVVCEIASTVLGKRSRSTEQERDTTISAAVKSESHSANKKARFSVLEEPARKQDDGISLSSTNRALKSRAPKDKKWLVSGLYAGQSRTFDATKSESQNKRKSNGTADQSAPVTENSVLPLPMFAGSRLLETGRDFRLPFDVFSPLPPGQPKPDEWRRVNKNVFVGDAAAEWRTNKFSEQSTCLCTPDNGCDSDCMNRFMYYECDERNCNLSPEQCGNRAFEGLKKRVKAGGQYNVGVEVLRTQDRGYGVRACRTFEPNQIIVEYTGEIINQEECEKRMHGLYKNNECYYLMAFDQNMIIDATRGSIARFVNHSCDPNCRMEKWTVGGKPKMALFASDRGIMTGEELTYDYNFDPYSQKNVQVCRCGASNCRGVLGPKPKDLPKKDKESALAGAKRKIAEVIEEGKEMMMGASKKRKTELKKLPKGWVYLEPEPKLKSTKPKQKNEEQDDESPSDAADGKLSRQPSKLKKILSDKSKAKNGRKIKVKNAASRGSKVKMPGRRVLSTNSTSSGTALIAAGDDSEQKKNGGSTPIKGSQRRSTGKSPKAKGTIKAKAGSLKGKVGRSIRGK